MKICRNCGISKSLNLFPKQKQNKDGYHSYCKECRSKYDVARYNSKKRSELYLANLDENRAARRKYYQQTKQEYYVRKAKRRASELDRTPSWLTKEDFNTISLFYHIAKLKQEITGIPHEVDHIIPLQGKTVCGLHVPWNLQILTQKENRKKANRL